MFCTDLRICFSLCILSERTLILKTNLISPNKAIKAVPVQNEFRYISFTEYTPFYYTTTQLHGHKCRV